MPKLIAQMVVKNEADRYLEEVLDHVKSIVDDIVITDDGSTDNTIEVAQKYTDNIYENKETMFTKHEGDLRQNAWRNLENHAKVGDIILCIDADEKLFETSYSIREMFTSPYDVFGVTFYHMWTKSHVRVDKAWGPVISSRLFRYRENGTFKDRRLACGSEPTYVSVMIERGQFFPPTGLIMQHLGYMRDDDKKIKYDRYMNLDKGEFHAKAHLESILDPSPTLCDWDKVLETLKKRNQRKVINGNFYLNRGQTFR